MWGWIQPLVSAAVWVFKALFGMDKPKEVEVINAKPKTPMDVKSDADLLADCGLRPRDRATGGDAVRDPASGGSVSDSRKP